MKTRKSWLLSMAFFAFASSSLLASDVDFKEPKSVNEQLYSYLKAVESQIDDDGVIYIDFMLNDKAEIIVLSTSDSEMDTMLKAVLNYKRLETSELEYNKKYTVPVRFDKK